MSVVSDTLVENYFINARLSNELYILLLPLTRIVSTLLSALCFLLMMLLAVRLGGFGRRPLAVGAFTAAAVFLLPWIDQLYLVTFQFNYILPMAITLAFFCLAIQPDSKPARHRSTLLFILGLLTGLCHEECASCAIASLIRFHHSARSKSRGHTALEYHPHCRLRPRPQAPQLLRSPLP